MPAKATDVRLDPASCPVPDGPHPDPSCLIHWVAAEPNGYRVTDVWKDKSPTRRVSHQVAMTGAVAVAR
jgi:hypothetical protein